MAPAGHHRKRQTTDLAPERKTDVRVFVGCRATSVTLSPRRPVRKRSRLPIGSESQHGPPSHRIDLPHTRRFVARGTLGIALATAIWVTRRLEWFAMSTIFADNNRLKVIPASPSNYRRDNAGESKDPATAPPAGRCRSDGKARHEPRRSELGGR